MKVYDSIGKFWVLWLPLLVGAVIYYGYSSGGFIGEWIRSLVDPLLGLAAKILNFIFGI